VRGDD